MTRAPLPFALAVLAACTGSRDGTWVGNPELTASYASTQTYTARTGELVATDASFVGCEGDDDTPLGPIALEFRQGRTIEGLQVPAGRFCGLRLTVAELTVRFDDGGPALTAVTARGFDLDIAAMFETLPDGEVHLQLAANDWLDSLAAQVALGEENEVAGNPALESAFFDGLEADSTVGDAPVDDDEPLAGRLDLEGYPVSPLGQPTTQAGCGPSVNFDMAFPIPPAAMATMGVDGVGWCDSNLDFTADLAPQTATLIDYSDLSTYAVTYNGWGGSCGSLHCGEVTDSAGVLVGRPCTLLVFCDGDGGTATATGYTW
ncbi:MAG: hypothetical protein R3F61_02465 [Myxococcota bacterium]